MVLAILKCGLLVLLLATDITSAQSARANEEKYRSILSTAEGIFQTTTDLPSVPTLASIWLSHPRTDHTAFSSDNFTSNQPSCRVHSLNAGAANAIWSLTQVYRRDGSVT